MTVMTPPYRSGLSSGRDGFGQLLHAEWTKFRTVRGWIIGLVIGVVVMAGLGLFTAGGASSSCQASGGGPVHSGAACRLGFALGPAGEPVNDSFYFVHQPLTGNGTITVRLTSMTGLLPPSTPPPTSRPIDRDTRPGVEPWAKAGIIIKRSLTHGSPYAAMMVAADNGVRMQWNYTGDTPACPARSGRRTRAGCGSPGPAT